MRKSHHSQDETDAFLFDSQRAPSALNWHVGTAIKPHHEANVAMLSFIRSKPHTGGVADTCQQLPRSVQRLVAEIRTRWQRLKTFSSDRLLQYSAELRVQARTTQLHQLNAVTLSAVALFSEALRRSLAVELYDVQLYAAVVTLQGKIAEMQTGEGKTFVSGAAAFVHGLGGEGVHVVTTNAYLAARDYAELAPTFEMCGVTVGLLPEEADLTATMAAYDCDVTYGTGYQFGFDFLRDQLDLRRHPPHPLGRRTWQELAGHPVTNRAGRATDNPTHLDASRRQRAWRFAVIDEIDSVLIDEAATPLILSGPLDALGAQDRRFAWQSQGHGHSESLELYTHAAKVVQEMLDTDFAIDAETSHLWIAPEFIERSQQALKTRRDIRLARPWQVYLENAVKAAHGLQRDADYVVEEDSVRLIDQLTGRIFKDRKWRDGLHQAVQAKEGVTIEPSETALVQMTRQRYFRGYRRLSGLTGTVTGSEQEFWNVYHLQTAVIPTHRISQRRCLPTQFFATADAQYRAVAAEAQRRQQVGQPVLIGTQTIRDTRRLSALLQQLNCSHTLLNGVQDESEASIIATAGHAGKVTLATNMAGRGTDIHLADEVHAVGGLHVIGLGPNASRRIDRQLIGRAARQGAPGSAQFFISADDPLLTRYAPSLCQQLQRTADSSGQCHRDFSKQIAQLQIRIERQQTQQRQQLLSRDQWQDQLRQRMFH